ncbi:MAG: hypothetical protein AAB446_00630 [Patescibacteria group bacterium]
MINVEQMLKIDPKLSSFSQEELEGIRASMYNFAQLAFDINQEGKKDGSKNPVRVFIHRNKVV